MTRKSFGLLAAMMCLALLALPVSRVHADPSGEIAVTVTITQELSVNVSPGSWEAGSSAALGSTSDTIGMGPSYFTATNNSNGPEDLTVTVSGSTNWVAGTAAGDEIFAMSLSTDDGSNWVVIDPSVGPATLADDLASGSDQTFDLQLAVPTSTAYAGVQQIITVTVTAASG